MIIASDEPREVGKSYTPDTKTLDNNDPSIPGQPLFVIREATRQEWGQYCIKTIGRFEIINPRIYKYFYEVSMD